MHRWSESRIGVKLFTGSCIGLLLSFGLCAEGSRWEGHGTHLQDFLAEAGVWLSAVAGISLLVSFALMDTESKKRRRK